MLTNEKGQSAHRVPPLLIPNRPSPKRRARSDRRHVRRVLAMEATIRPLAMPHDPTEVRLRLGVGKEARLWTQIGARVTAHAKRHRPVPVSVPLEVLYPRHPAAISAASRGTNGGVSLFFPAPAGVGLGRRATAVSRRPSRAPREVVAKATYSRRE